MLPINGRYEYKKPINTEAPKTGAFVFIGPKKMIYQISLYRTT